VARTSASHSSRYRIRFQRARIAEFQRRNSNV
jgi:hypothetical protein